MMCKNMGIYGFVGPSWVLITPPPRKIVAVFEEPHQSGTFWLESDLFCPFSGVRKYVPRLCSWYYLVASDTGWYTTAHYSTVPSRTGTAVHVLFRFLPSRRFLVACFVITG